MFLYFLQQQANSELIYKKPQLEELEAKIDELRDANKQLREINEQVNEKAEILQQVGLIFKLVCQCMIIKSSCNQCR